VLLHGGSGSWNHWVRTIPALAANFRVIAIDLPGFGDSSLPRTVRSAHDLAQCTAYAIGRLVPPGGFGLVGFSFGGIIAGLVAAQRRSRATRLVLVAAGGLGLAGNVEGTLVAVPRHATREERFAAHRHNLAVLMISDPAKVDDLAVVLHDENVAKARFRTGSIPASTTLADALPAVRGRITYLAGERDAFGRDNGDRRGRLLRALRPDVEYVPVADAGHWAMYEQPETVNALLLERLTSG
jgi:pimeloyl-ACP methyl ester carboxylesterase